MNEGAERRAWQGHSLGRGRPRGPADLEHAAHAYGVCVCVCVCVCQGGRGFQALLLLESEMSEITSRR